LIAGAPYLLLAGMAWTHFAGRLLPPLAGGSTDRVRLIAHFLAEQAALELAIFALQLSGFGFQLRDANHKQRVRRASTSSKAEPLRFNPDRDPKQLA
jgi:hypothetical protein